MSEIRTRQQGSTPFFPNMLNNGSVEVCLKEDVDKVITEKDKEIAELQEERRWRKFSEETPKEEDEYYLVFDKYGYRDTDRWRKDKYGVWGFSVHGESVRYFMPQYARNWICDFILGKKQDIGQLSLF